MNRGRAPMVAGIALLVAVAAAIMWLSEPAAVPFDVDSSAPDGYRAVRILLEDSGVEVRSARATDLLEDPPPSGQAVVVPVWDYLDDTERLELEALAESGVLLVRSAMEYFVTMDNSALAHAPAIIEERGYCDILELEEMTAIDSFDGLGVAPDSEAQLCFGDRSSAAVVQDDVGAGAVIELDSPYLWANARLQPNKEEGGVALDNGPMAVAILAEAGSVTFVEAKPTPGVTPEGTRNPLELLPFGVKLALAQAVGAFVLYAWWRGRRLGRPVREEMPVEVAGSELVEAVGGLLRREGSPAGAARVVRHEFVRTVGARLGVPPDAGPDAMAQLIAMRTGRDPAEVHAVLVSGQVGSAEGLVHLIRQLDSIRTEVLDGQPIA